jgi:hypothetical protein
MVVAGSQIARPREIMTRARRISLLVVIALLTVAVHGYHSGTDDGAIYVPGINKAADPSLYPFGSEFFMHHAQLSLFPQAVASVTWLTRIPIEWSMLFWFVFTQFLLLYAAYELARECFRSERARWGGVGLLAAVLSVPVAGTALLIADSYLTARSLSTPLVLMAIACFLGARNRASIHESTLVHDAQLYEERYNLVNAADEWLGFSVVPLLRDWRGSTCSFSIVASSRVIFCALCW